MSIIISGALGAAKTLYCMSEIDRISKKHPNRLIYTNIIGCTYPGVIMIQSTTHRPFDWRDLPNGAVLIYDEAHEHPAFSKEDLLKTYEIDDSECIKNIATINASDLKVKEKEELVRQERKKQDMKLVKAKDNILDIGRSLTLHRHFGIEIYFITQKPFKLNESVKASVVEHLVIRRLFKLRAATIYTFAELQEQFGFSTMKNALSWRFWLHPKQLYKFYISAEEHDKSKKIPFSLIFWLIVPIVLAASALKDSYNSPMFSGVLEYFGLKSKAPVEQVAQQQTQTDKATVTKNDEIDCNLTSNLHLEQCQRFQKQKNEELQSSVRQAIGYNPNDPYKDLSASFNYQASTQPVFSGCVKYKGKYYAYTQQGTKLSVPEADCRRLIEDGDRPFNYFASPQAHTERVSTSGQTQTAPMTSSL
ncbi:zonular occludens toxin domain-containing protein [Acinetobacter higginsii]|uniref:zonular occludens toxin domain-containing protein n=1 Tax=Acinetobacter higginsii TaxID=70347 RepID=UPI001F4AE07F|nr:zonular occludens toxin domain-containing protein [Acinetobacter higginsii]MCH7341733.1 zonular occludens toxin domain-containing protein [Acinetobacter higginsii]